MAQLDTSIALGIRPSRIKSPDQIRQEQLNIRADEQAIDLNEQNLAMNRQRLSDAQAKAKRDSEGIQVLSELMAEKGADDYEGITKGLAERGRADLVPQFATMHRANRLAALNNEEKELKIAQDKHKILAQTLATIKDPATYYNAIGIAIQNKWLPLDQAQQYAARGYNAETMAEIDQLKQSSQTLEQQMDEYRKAQEEKRKELLFPIEKAGKELDNTKKKQETTGTVPMQPKDEAQLEAQRLTREQQAEQHAATLAETRRGHNLTDARLRESNAVAGAKLEAGAVQTIADLENGLKQLKRLKSDINEGASSMGMLGAIATAPIIGPAIQRAGYNKPAVLKAKIGLARQVIGKALEGGVLRKEDEDKYRSLLADIGDQPDTAFQKIDNLTTELESKLSTFKDTNLASGRKPLAGGGSPGSSGGLKVVKNDADYDAIPSGAEYFDDKGVRRRKR